jgi:hypothetical protein
VLFTQQNIRYIITFEILNVGLDLHNPETSVLIVETRLYVDQTEKIKSLTAMYHKTQHDSTDKNLPRRLPLEHLPLNILCCIGITEKTKFIVNCGSLWCFFPFLFLFFLVFLLVNEVRKLSSFLSGLNFDGITFYF